MVHRILNLGFRCARWVESDDHQSAHRRGGWPPGPQLCPHLRGGRGLRRRRQASFGPRGGRRHQHRVQSRLQPRVDHHYVVAGAVLALGRLPGQEAAEGHIQRWVVKPFFFGWETRATRAVIIFASKVVSPPPPVCFAPRAACSLWCVRQVSQCLEPDALYKSLRMIALWVEETKRELRCSKALQGRILAKKVFRLFRDLFATFGVVKFAWFSLDHPSSSWAWMFMTCKQNVKWSNASQNLGCWQN